MHRVERLSIREIHRRTGLHRETIRRALRGDEPPRYRRVARGGSKLDGLKPWIDEQLRADPRIPSKRLRELAGELGYEGGKTIFDDWVRRSALASFVGGRISARCIGPASCASSIFGSRGSRSRSATGRRGGVGC